MIPGTTPTFTLSIKNGTEYLADTANVRVDIRQQDVLISKEMKDLTINLENNTITFVLTQKESLKFLYKKGNMEFQVCGILNDGTVWRTYVVEVPVEKILSNEVLKNE